MEKMSQKAPQHDPLADQPGEPRGYRRVMHDVVKEGLQDFVEGTGGRAWPEVGFGEEMPPEYYEATAKYKDQPSLSEQIYAAREQMKREQALKQAEEAQMKKEIADKTVVEQKTISLRDRIKKYLRIDRDIAA